MQHDDLIWKLIGQGFCTYKVKNEQTLLCRNEYNVNGLCKPAFCPLANSRYVTVREEKGVCSLYIKTVERAHAPSRMWEKIALPKNYEESLKIIDSNLLYWPEYMIHKAKQRFTVIYQYLLRMKKLKLKEKTQLVTINKKIERRDQKREEKALKTARIEKHIQEQLLERLKEGKYDEIYNFDQNAFKNIVGEAEEEAEEASVDEQYENAGVKEYVEDSDLENDKSQEIEDIFINTKKSKLFMNVDKVRVSKSKKQKK